MFIRDITLRDSQAPLRHPAEQKKTAPIKRRYYLFFGIGTLCLLGMLFSFYLTQAQVVSFYPTSCLGTWTDPVAVQGKPDGFDGDTFAKLSGFGAEIFCGAFTGEIPNDTVPKSFVLKFAWRMPEQDIPASASLVEGVESIIEAGSSTPSEDAPIPTEVSTDSILEQKDADTASAEESQESAATEVLEIKDIEPLPPVEVAPAPEPISWWGWLINNALAQEVAETPTTTDAVINLDTASSSIAETSTSSVTVATTTSSISESQKTLFEVYYTLDGSLWNHLGSVTKDSLSTIEFPIPLKLWSDVSTIQIRIVSVPTILELPEVQLDSMWIETAYAEKMTDVFLPPNFAKDILLGEKILDGIRVVKIERPSGEVEIWYRAVHEDKSEGDWQRVAGSEYVVERNSPITIHSNIIFWANKDRRVLYGFHTLASGYQSQSYNAQEYVSFDFNDVATERWQVGFREAEDKFEFLRVAPKIDVQE
ncbi:MAG: hypothetical protein EXS68_01545 [Candidatus Ryanbacteria bacterium]|nr:hypothetical protein [Candidatus Ryanbacteria bacterium]